MHGSRNRALLTDWSNYKCLVQTKLILLTCTNINAWLFSSLSFVFTCTLHRNRSSSFQVAILALRLCPTGFVFGVVNVLYLSTTCNTFLLLLLLHFVLTPPTSNLKRLSFPVTIITLHLCPASLADCRYGFPSLHMMISTLVRIVLLFHACAFTTFRQYSFRPYQAAMG